MQANFANVSLHCELAAMTAVVVLGLLSLIPAVPLASTDQIFVRPSEDTPCPCDACYLLPHVLQSSTEYLTSNTIVTLTPGHYLVNEDILAVIGDVSNLTIMGSNSGSTVIIVCSQQFGLVFSNAAGLLISNLHFFNCSQRTLSTANLIVLTANYSNVTLINISFVNLVGSSIHARHSNVKLLGKTVFDGIRCHSGCGISANNSNIGFLGTVVFQNNNCSDGCGIASFGNTNILFNGSAIFKGNKAEGSGSGIFVYNNSKVEFFGTAMFQNNICSSGCGIAAWENINISFTGSVTFEGNKAEGSGSGIYVLLSTNLEFLGTAMFQNNICSSGCGIAAWENINISFTGSVTFEGNKAEVSASGIYVLVSSNLEFLGTAMFQNNTCNSDGCGIAALQNINISFGGSVTFEGNKAEGSGSGITILIYGNLEFLGTATFHNNTCSSGCGITAYGVIDILFNGSATFEGNKAEVSGSGIFICYLSNLEFLGTIVFQNNTCNAGCGIFAMMSSKISFIASAIFEENEAHSIGGAVVTHTSTMKFNSSATLHNNRAAQGGALYLIERNASLLLDTGAEIKFTGNYVSETGGAIHIESSTLSCRLMASIRELELLNLTINIGTCFYQCVNEQACPKVHLQDNRAEVAGNAIYGDVQKCAPFNDIISIQSFDNQSDLSLIASDPTRVCFCMNGTPNCSILNQNRTLYPGETFEIPVVVVGDAWGVTTGAALVVLPSNASLAKAQISQALQLPLCTNLTYNVYSDPGTVTIQLVTKKVQVTESNAESGSCTTIYFHLTLLPCPPGFQVDSNGACNCNQILRNHDIFNCSIDNKTVYRPNHYWISASVNGSATVHEQCPLDYCVPHNVPIIPKYPDKQCQVNRSGTLCGGCKVNLSMVFGSSRCLRCSNWWLFLIPLFAFAGIALVFLLTVFNLNISVGTINGLIFYANIVRANTAVFFPPTQSTAVMIPSVFMAWLNLDLGIDVCFYDGLDTFAKTWLQLVFPVYVWILVIGIIISSHYSTRAARLSGKNSVPVLATLFLLSYAKLLRVIIAAFSFTTLDTYQLETTANSSREYVWLYNGNVQYLQGKHIPLFLAAVVILAALAAPYTLMVIFVQCLQRYRYRLLFWVRRLKPLFDAYTGPNKDRHRYWTGLLLLVRVALFLFFAVIQNVVGQPSLSLLAIVFTAVCLLVFHGIVGGVYKLVYLNLLESFFLVNLICFSGATLYTALTGGNQVAAICTSVGLAFAVFVILVLHGAYRSVRGFQCITRFPRNRRHHYTLVAQPLTDGHVVDGEAQPQGQRVTSQVLFFNELREPVMEYCEESNN